MMIYDSYNRVTYLFNNLFCTNSFVNVGTYRVFDKKEHSHEFIQNLFL